MSAWNHYRFLLLRGARFGHDLTVSLVAFLLAYLTAYGHVRVWSVPGLPEKAGAFMLICAAVFWIFPITRGTWRYVSVPDLVTITKASLAAVILYTVAAFLVTRGEHVPRSVPLLTCLFMIVGLSGTRLAFRLAVEGHLGTMSLHGINKKRRYVLLLGVTDRAESFIRATHRAAQKAIRVAGIIDDIPDNRQRTVQGVRVLGSLHDLQTIVARLRRDKIDVSELVVTEHQPDRSRLGVILEAATGAGLKVVRIQDETEAAVLTRGRMLEPKAIELEDLLGRPEVPTDLEGVARLINGKSVLVTGSGGSIGSELCRQIAMFSPGRLILADSSEYNLYRLEGELLPRFPQLDIVALIVDVRDRNRVFKLFADAKPEVVFHAAALKQVPLVEANPLEGIKTNVFGTRNVADAADEYGTSTVVLISTDKAVNPTSVMGATKRVAEIYCQALDLTSRATRFKTVRFGNVLGSAGSVVPLFREQIARGGPVTVTHPNIVRFFMTTSEAVRLVLNASAHGLRRQTPRGHIMVLDMGKPVRIVDLAERMIQLAGFRPRIDIDIVYSELRPGEKLYEELFDPSEIQEDSADNGYFIAAPRLMDRAMLRKSLVELEGALLREDHKRALDLLMHIVPEFRNRQATEGQEHSQIFMRAADLPPDGS